MKKIIIFLQMIFLAGFLCAADGQKYKAKYKNFEDAVIAGNVPDAEYYTGKAKNTDINKPLASGDTPLLYSVKQNDLPMVKFLVEKGADINFKSGVYFPYAVAVGSGYEDIAGYFDKSGKLNRESINAALLEAAGDAKTFQHRQKARNNKVRANTGNKELFKYLAEEKNADIKSNEGNILIRAIHNNNIDIMNYMIEKGADINAKSIFMGRIPLFEALDAGTAEMMELLVKNGADINARNSAGVTLLFAALNLEDGRDRNEKIKYLIDTGADVNAETDFNMTPFLEACRLWDFEHIKLFIDRGADINAEGSLPYSVQKRELEILSYLIDKGADVKTKNGAYALLTAMNADNNEAVKYLKELGADAALAGYKLPKKYQRFKETFTDVYINVSY